MNSDGWVMLVGPVSGDSPEDSFNPVGRVYLGFSVLLCLPSGLSAEPAAALGNQVGPIRTLRIAHDAGFTRAREVLRTPFNMVYELRP